MERNNIKSLIDRHWIPSNVFSCYLGLIVTHCSCGEFMGTYSDYQLHVHASHAAERAFIDSYGSVSLDS